MASRFLKRTTKFHITSPIFYPNAKPHLGHLYSSLLCDVQCRWNKLLGKDTLFTTGTDEHGLKIQSAAEQKGYQNPKEFVDQLCKHFIELDRTADIEFTRFIRTTDPDHVENTKKLWTLCWENGHIYKGEHKGWYSVSDETFYPDSKVVTANEDGELKPFDGIFDPNCKYVNTESGNEVVYQTETNYFFRLSAFQKPLIEFMRRNPTFIHPPSRYAQILRELENNKLNDLSVSRPTSRLQWGISVPQDDSQKIYVWFDALCNYITSIGGIDAVKGDAKSVRGLHNTGNIIENPRNWWENTTHLVGKDIIKFHTIYWPAFLMGANLPMPKQVVVHGHWLSGGVKMSKSLGNVVDPMNIIKYYGADTTRWYILENSNLEDDGNFIERNLHETRELFCSKLGNLINRCGGKKFSLRDGVSSFHGKSIDELSQILPTESKNSIRSMVESVNESLEKTNECYHKYDITGAQRIIWNIINEANSFLQSTEPWTKKGQERDLIIYSAMEAARVAIILSQPIIPEISRHLLNRLDVEDGKRSLEYARFGSDDSYGKSTNDKHREIPLERIPYRLENE